MQRLFEIIYMLMERDGITAKDLAQRLEVSSRTIRRDIDALSAAGIPVYSTRGRSGGIHLMPHFVLNKTLLTADEQNEILFALQSLKAVGASDSQNVLPRLSGLFRREQVDWIDVDFCRWGSRNAEREEFRLIKSSILNHCVLQFDYFGTRGDCTKRTVEPYRLSFKSNSWYLQGWCLDRQDYRTFKLRRIQNLQLLDATFPCRTAPIPEIDDPEDTLPTEPIVLHFSPRIAFRVLDEFSPECTEIQSDGSYIVNMDWSSEIWGCSYFLSFGAEIEILSPPELREQLRMETEKILSKYVK